MSFKKSIRDPMYGYIELSPEFARLVDTPEFQRLRNIRQTGYQALYPSALHNRFVHSLGVYYLGCKAIDFFEKNIEAIMPEDIKNQWGTIKATFIAACLLHDVGHSPFSHAGENYYTKDGFSFEKQYLELWGIPEDYYSDRYPIQSDNDIVKKNFCADLSNPDGTGKAHEAMSSLIGLELCGESSLAIDKDLFIRAIIGMKYGHDFSSPTSPRADLDKKLSVVIKNALISLLNGDLIDVDKLDYVMRDSFVTGYNSLSIDLERLLSGYTVFQNLNGTYEAAFMKGALSVIENVIYANDLERRWIQNHPSILYDGWLVDLMLRRYNSYMCKQASVVSVFTKKALSKEGMPAEAGITQPLRLLCDDDIIYYIKNIDNSPEGRQYFYRSERFKPLWKTEAAFERLTDNAFGQGVLQDILKTFDDLLNFDKSKVGILIDQKLVDQLEKTCQETMESGGGIKTASYEKARRICQIFLKFADEHEFKAKSFVLVLAKSFQTNYNKNGIKNMKIIMNGEAVPLSNVLAVRAKEATRASTNFFCVYTADENIQAYRGLDLGAEFITYLRRGF